MLRRVLHMTGTMDRAGAETMIMNLYREIDRSQIQFDFVFFSNKKEAVPLVLIESQCFCLPAVVFSHLTSELDIVQDSAIIADYNEPINSLANSLQLLIEDEKLYQSLYEKTLLNRTAFSQTTFFEKWDKLLVND
jgi:glycosyltransferase involved in cell wall biosynthesis